MRLDMNAVRRYVVHWEYDGLVRVSEIRDATLHTNPIRAIDHAGFKPRLFQFARISSRIA